jgi:PEP-CTERM motif
MKQLAVTLSAVVILSAALSPLARATTIDLYDFALSTSSGVSGDWQDLSANDPTTFLNAGSTIVCCGDASGGTTPGLGTLSYTFNGAPGSYTVSMYFDYDVSTPFYNEFGVINNGGAAQSGITYEIFNASSSSGNIVLFPATGAPGGETYGFANNTNLVPGTTDNFSSTCTSVAVCNSDVGSALTFSFQLAANQFAVLSAAASTTNPGGFSLQTVHPIDTSNNSASSVYLTGSYVIDTNVVGTGTPEPSTWVLLGTSLALFVFTRRKSRA